MTALDSLLAQVSDISDNMRTDQPVAETAISAAIDTINAGIKASAATIIIGTDDEKKAVVDKLHAAVTLILNLTYKSLAQSVEERTPESMVDISQTIRDIRDIELLKIGCKGGQAFELVGVSALLLGYSLGLKDKPQ